MTPRAGARLAGGAAAGAVAVFALWGLGLDPYGRPHAHDLNYYYYPLYEVTFRWIAERGLPLWSPFHLCGRPWLATVQAGVFYPPRSLYLLLPAHVALLVSTALHLALAAGGTALFARRAGLTAAAALLGAAVFSLRGTIPDWTRYPSLLEAAAWLPLGAVAVLGLTRSGELRSALGLALATGMSFLAGYPQVTLFAALAWGTLLLARVVGAAPGARRGRAVALAGAGVAAGTALAAVQLLPSFELVSEGTRQAAQLSRAEVWVPESYGFFAWAGGVRGSAAALGVVVLALAPAALLHRDRATRILAGWALLLGLASYVLASGTAPSLIDFYLALPIVNWFRSPQRLLLVCHFGAAVAAAIGLDAVREDRRAAALAAGLALALAVAALSGPGPTPDAVSSAIATGVAVAGVALLRRTRAAVAAAALAALACADAWLAPAWRATPSYRPERAALYRENDAFYGDLARLADGDRVVSLYLSPERGLKRAALFDLRRLGDFEPMNLARQAQYFRFLRDGSPEPARRTWGYAGGVLPLPGMDFARQLLAGSSEIPGGDLWSRRRLLDLAAARFVIGPARLLDIPGVRTLVERQAFVPRASPDPRFTLLENPQALPRAFVTHRARPAPPAPELLARLASPDFDPLAASYVEGDPGLPAPDASTPTRGAPARIVRDDPTRVEVEAELSAAGLLVLADTYARGWRASAAGRPVPILATNHLFRGVPLPAGRHRVRFDYRPPGLRGGAALSGSALLLLAAAALHSALRSASRKRP